ncbi:MAG: RNA polymerase sigma factor [bacterium]
MAESHDNLLVRKTLKGDNEAFRLIVERYKNALFNLAYRLTQNRESAEDLAQEAFVRAYEHLERFDQQRSLFTWLYTICTNLTINELKKKGHYADRERNTWEQKGEDERIASDTWSGREFPEGEQKVDAEEKKDLLNELLGKIPDEYRTAVILRYQEELSYQEIAEVLGVSLSLAKVRVHRGIEKLRTIFQEMENLK